MVEAPRISRDGAPPELLGSGTVRDPGHRKLIALEGLRGIAVLSVMAVHYNQFLPDTPWLRPFKSLFDYGWAGVDLFFVLSGFLITGILLRTKAAPNYFSTFYMRRVLRIFPIYYATLLAVLAGSRFFPGALERAPHGAEWWLYFAYFQNWIAVWKHGWPPNVLGHFWSLGVEEQFYLVWPWVVLVCSRKRLMQVAIAGCVAALVLRCVWVALGGQNDGVTLATVSRMDSLMLGAIAALVYLSAREGKRVPNLLPWSIVPLGAFAITAYVIGFSLTFIQSVGFSLLGLGFVAIVLPVALGDGTNGAVQRILRSRPLTAVGRYSYGMYVYHLPILGLLEVVIWQRLSPEKTSSPLFALGYVVFLALLTFGVAALSFELVEKPILSLKTRFEPKI